MKTFPLEGPTVAVSWHRTIECSGVTCDVREARWLGSGDSLTPERSYWWQRHRAVPLGCCFRGCVPEHLGRGEAVLTVLFGGSSRPLEKLDVPT